MKPGNVSGGIGGAIEAAIGGREGFGIARGQCCGAARIAEMGQLRLDRFAPAAHHGLQLGVELGFVGAAFSLPDIDDKAQQRQAAAFDFQAPVERLALSRALQQPLHLPAHGGRDRIARQPDEGENVALKRRADQQQLGPGPVDQADHRTCGAFEIGRAETDQQIVRQLGQGMDQRLAGVAARIDAERAGQFGKMRADAGHVLRRGGQRSAGPDTGVDRQRGDPAALELRHQKQIERHPAMDLADDVGLDDQRRSGRGRFALGVEPGEGALVAGRGEQFLRALAADAERALLAAVAAAGDMAELGEHAVMQPVQQRCAFTRVGVLAQRSGIARQCFAQLWPVGHGSADIRQHRLQRSAQAHAAAGIGAGGFDIDNAIRADRPGARQARSTVRASRAATLMTGCSSRSMASPCAAIAAASELTMNGISSPTTAIRISRSPTTPGTVSMAIAGVPASRCAAVSRTKRAAAVKACAVNGASPGSSDAAKCRDNAATRLSGLPWLIARPFHCFKGG